MSARAVPPRALKRAPRGTLRVGATAAAAMTCALAAVAGCGQREPLYPSQSFTAPSPDASSTSPDALAVPTSNYNFTVIEPGGTKLDVTIALTAGMPADSPETAAAWQQLAVDPPSPASCSMNPSRDAVVVGSISIVNETPKYEPLTQGFSVTSDALFNCGDGTYSLISPDTTDGSAQPISFLINNVYGPDGVNHDRYEASRDFSFAAGGEKAFRAGLNVTIEQDYIAQMVLPGLAG